MIAPANSTFPPLSEALPKLLSIVNVLLSIFTAALKSTKSPEVVTTGLAPLNVIRDPDLLVTTKFPSVL